LKHTTENKIHQEVHGMVEILQDLYKNMTMSEAMETMLK